VIHLDVSAAIARGAGKRRIDFAVIHTEGDGVNNDTSAAAIRAWHRTPKPKGPGWRDIGYNFWIRMNGLVELGRPLTEVPAHAEGFNVHTLGIGLAGDGDIRDFALAQYDSLFDLCWLLGPRFRLLPEHFIGHREVVKFGAPDPHKTCPGRKVDLDKFRAMLAEPR
jgi:hypothetical protein